MSADLVMSFPTELSYSIHDVLCGRGGLANKHSGNRVYRRLVEAKKQLYQRLADKKDRNMLVDSIILAVHSIGARFLKYHDDTDSWYEIDYKEAFTKTSQAFREPDRKQKPSRQVLSEKKAVSREESPYTSDDECDDDASTSSTHSTPQTQETPSAGVPATVHLNQGNTVESQRDRKDDALQPQTDVFKIQLHPLQQQTPYGPVSRDSLFTRPFETVPPTLTCESSLGPFGLSQEYVSKSRIVEDGNPPPPPLLQMTSSGLFARGILAPPLLESNSSFWLQRGSNAAVPSLLHMHRGHWVRDLDDFMLQREETFDFTYKAQA